MKFGWRKLTGWFQCSHVRSPVHVVSEKLCHVRCPPAIHKFCGRVLFIMWMCFCWTNKKNHWYKINTKESNDYIFATQRGTHSETMCKWNMNSTATKHMNSYKVVFDIYKVIAPLNVHLGDDYVVAIIRVNFIVVEVMLTNIKK